MSNLLEAFIKDEIERNGPMSVGQFMSLALGHPEHGYYMKQDPFGRAGDFVTAPEVSQLFGEMLGVWAADVWMQMGQPETLVLLECGPGRGTLMADMMRATRNVAGFHSAVDVHLLEISPVLKGQQGGTLEGVSPQWHDGLETVPEDAPMIVVGNEFLDALPFKQSVKTDLGEVERKVTVDENGDLVFTAHGKTTERAPERVQFVQEICTRLKAQRGAALFVDYGHVRSGAGDTFQAIKGHEYVDVLSDVGDADLTSHVDFAVLKDCADIDVGGPVAQGAFLNALGIGIRAQKLAQNASPEQAEILEKGLHRLVHADQMGELFKVIGFWSCDGKSINPAGF